MIEYSTSKLNKCIFSQQKQNGIHLIKLIMNLWAIKIEHYVILKIKPSLIINFYIYWISHIILIFLLNMYNTILLIKMFPVKSQVIQILYQNTMKSVHPGNKILQIQIMQSNKSKVKEKINSYFDRFQLAQIHCHQSKFKAPYQIMMMVMLIESLQQLLFIFIPNFSKSSIRDQGLIMRTFIYIIRFDILIVNFDNLMIAWLMPFVFFVTQIIVYVVLHLLYKNNTSYEFIILLNKENTKTEKYLIMFQSYYYQVFWRNLYIPFHLICIQSIKHNLLFQQNFDSAICIIMAVLTLILIILQQIYFMLVIDQSINLKLAGLERMNITIYDYLLYFLFIFQLLIYAVLSVQAVTVQEILICIISTVGIFNQILNKSYKQFRQLYLICKCINLGITLPCLLIDQIFIGYIVIGGLLTSIIIKIVLGEDNYYHYQRIQTLFSKVGDIQSLKFCILEILNQEVNLQDQIIYNSIIQNIHRQKCKITNCECQKIVVSNNAVSCFKIPILLQKQLEWKLIQKYKKLTTDHQKFEFNHVIHFIAFLQINGYFIYSIKFINQILFKTTSHASQESYAEKFKDRSQRFLEQSSSFLTKRQMSSQDSQIDEIKNKNRNKVSKIMNFQNLDASSINQIKLLFLLYHSKSQISTSFNQYDLNQESNRISQNIQQFLRFEGTIINTKKQFKKIIQKKINFMQSLISDAQFNYDKALKTTLDIGQQMYQLELQLIEIYKQFPTKKIQSVFCYFYAEIMNDYMGAQKIITITAMSDASYILSEDITEGISYIQLTLDDNLSNLRVFYVPQSFHAKFGKVEYFEEVLPNYIRHEHSVLVSRFISTGQSRYYKNFNLNFIQLENGFTSQVNLCFDIYHSQSQDQLVFAAFLQYLKFEQPCILIDVNGHIGGLNQNFFRMFDIKDDISQKLNEIHLQEKIQAKQLLPEYPSYVSINSSNFVLLDQELCYLTKDGIDQLFQLGLKLKSQLKTIMRSIVVNLTVYKREIYGFYFYVVLIDTVSQSQARKTEMAYDSEYRYSISVEEESISKINHITIKPFPEQIREQPSNQIQLIYNNSDTRRFPVIDFDDSKFVQLLSPNQSQSLIQQEQERKQFNQQEYFDNNQLNQSHSISKEAKISGNIQKQIKYDVESNGSSVFGMNKSVYFKKYQFIQSLLEQSNPSIIIQIIFLSFIIMIIFIVFAIIILIVASQDIGKFLQEIDMIALHSSFMAPHDYFFSLRVTVSAYQQQQVQGFITTTAQLNSLINPAYQYVGLGYLELQSNFYSLLQDENLQLFFTDVYSTVYFMNNTPQTIVPRNITFRQQLFLTLEGQYKFKKAFDVRGSTSNTSYQVFQFANYYSLHDYLESLTVAVQNDSKLRSINLISKWQNLWIIFLILAFLLNICLIYIYHKYLKLQEIYLQSYQQIGVSYLYIEMERYKNLQKQIEADDNRVVGYQFDLDYKENQLKQSNNSTNNIVQKESKKQTKNFKLLSRIPSIIMILFIYIFYCAYSTFVVQRTLNYLNKYSQTTDLYKLIQDLRFRGGNMFLYREIFYRWSNFTFLTQANNNSNYYLITNSTDCIARYLLTIPSLNVDNLLISQDFVNTANHLQENDICPYLDETYRVFLTPYCNLAFQGSIRGGLGQTLNYLKNYIIQQQAINNFTRRTQLDIYDLEGGQIITRIFFYLGQQFKEGMINLTNSQNQINQAISISFILLDIICILLLVAYINKYLVYQYQILKRFVFIVPIRILLTNDQFERTLKNILNNQVGN
ncbi:hypothetical protein pb186bvf_009450 [Paramecium bursaria]